MAKKNEKNLNAHISDDQLENVSGGAIFYAKGFGHNRKWELIDDETGEVLGRYWTKKGVTKAADAAGQSKTQLSWDELKAKRHY